MPDKAEAVLRARHAVILAGGSGTRLWPLSRRLSPKQLLALDGEKTLLQLTVERVLGSFDAANVWIVTNEAQVFEVRAQVRALNPELERNVLAEPLTRNTLPAVLLALDRIVPVGGGNGRDALLAVFPSDHVVGGGEAWTGCLESCLALAAEGRFVTIGIPPREPQTGYGYIERGASIAPGVFESPRFVEKPELARAQDFVMSGRYYWNSGMFFCPAGLFLDAVRANSPELWAWFSARASTPLVRAYGGLPSVSVDRGVAERMPSLAVVEATFDWDDLGNWEALYRLGKKDARGNVVHGDVIALDCSGCFLMSAGGKLAAAGLRDAIIVQTRDATLACRFDDVQRVRDIVAALRAEGSPLAETHLTVRRPWGSYTVLETGPLYKIKRIEVLPGALLSLQLHHHRSEHWVVVSGSALVEIDGEKRLLAANQSADVPKETRHRLSNPGDVPLELIEIQSGSYLEEDDIVRFDDVYGRGGNRDS